MDIKPSLHLSQFRTRTMIDSVGQIHEYASKAYCIWCLQALLGYPASLFYLPMAQSAQNRAVNSHKTAESNK